MRIANYKQILPVVLLTALLPTTVIAEPKVLIHIQGQGYVDSQKYHSQYRGTRPYHPYAYGATGIPGHRSFGAQQQFRPHQPPHAGRHQVQPPTVAPDSNVRPRNNNRHHSYNFYRGR
ncbi:MAG: hypothetical protein JJU48_04810 [Methylophaga sp.]|nr:hypothetical protein [Methylophaga sp.]